jgi:hypothetical protein
MDQRLNTPKRSNPAPFRPCSRYHTQTQHTTNKTKREPAQVITSGSEAMNYSVPNDLFDPKLGDTVGFVCGPGEFPTDTTGRIYGRITDQWGRYLRVKMADSTFRTVHSFTSVASALTTWADATRAPPPSVRTVRHATNPACNSQRVRSSFTSRCATGQPFSKLTTATS